MTIGVIAGVCFQLGGHTTDLLYLCSIVQLRELDWDK